MLGGDHLLTLLSQSVKKGDPTNKSDSGYAWAVELCCFWNHVQSWQILECMSGGDQNTVPFHNTSLVISLAEEKKMEANRGNKLYGLLQRPNDSLRTATDDHSVENLEYLLLQMALLKFGSFF